VPSSREYPVHDFDFAAPLTCLYAPSPSTLCPLRVRRPRVSPSSFYPTHPPPLFFNGHNSDGTWRHVLLHDPISPAQKTPISPFLLHLDPWKLLPQFVEPSRKHPTRRRRLDTGSETPVQSPTLSFPQVFYAGTIFSAVSTCLSFPFEPQKSLSVPTLRSPPLLGSHFRLYF